jgi:hypothetical protein
VVKRGNSHAADKYAQLAARLETLRAAATGIEREMADEGRRLAATDPRFCRVCGARVATGSVHDAEDGGRVERRRCPRPCMNTWKTPIEREAAR